MGPLKARKERMMSNELEKAEKDLQEARTDLTKAEKEVAEAEKKLAAAEKEIEEAKKKKEEIEVSISTTSGFYPTEGFNSIPEKQAVQHELDKAKGALRIKDVNGWIATVVTPAGKRTLDPAKNYAENGLVGKAEIDWGPSEGGGG
jgi:exonuclease VII small subunit